MFLLNNNPLPVGVAFTHNSKQYPANWLQLSTELDKSNIGISEVPDPEVYDDRFWWGVDNPKDLDQCKANLISQVKTTAASLLAPTDWKITRFIETAAPVGVEITEYRTAVRAASNTNESAIITCTTVNELAAIQFTWPE